MALHVTAADGCEPPFYMARDLAIYARLVVKHLRSRALVEHDGMTHLERLLIIDGVVLFEHPADDAAMALPLL